MNATVMHPSRSWSQRLSELFGRFFEGGRAIAWHELDARTLRDIGIDASEIDSIAAEASGRAAPTRRRIVATDSRD